MLLGLFRGGEHAGLWDGGQAESFGSTLVDKKGT